MSHNPIATHNVQDAGAILLDAIKQVGIEPARTSTDWSAWNSGIYCLLDAVFSARAKYEVTILAFLLCVDSGIIASFSCPRLPLRF